MSFLFVLVFGFFVHGVFVCGMTLFYNSFLVLISHEYINWVFNSFLALSLPLVLWRRVDVWVAISCSEGPVWRASRREIGELEICALFHS